jgi:hypothetical protein
VAITAQALKKSTMGKSLQSTQWHESHDLSIFWDHIYIPKDADLHCRIVEQHHDSHIVGHGGWWIMLEMVSHNYWWPQMSGCYIGKYCKTCNLCLWTKVQKQPPMGELKLVPIPEGHWDVASVDFIVELPESQGHDTIMVVVDSVGKQVHFIENHTTVTALRATWLYLQHVWKLHGLLQTMISNHGPQFVTQFTYKPNCLLSIRLAASTAYHPQTDRQMKHVNRELEQYLWVFMSEQKDNWTELLPLTEFQYNNYVHASTQHSPFLLNTGCHPHMGLEPNEALSHMGTVNEFQDQMVSTWKRQNLHWQRQKTTWHSTTTATALQHWCTRLETWCTWIPETSAPPGHPRNLHTTISDPTRLRNMLEPMPTTLNSLLLCPACTQSSMLSSCFQLHNTQSLVNDPLWFQNWNSLMERNTMRLRKFLTANSSVTNCNTLVAWKGYGYEENNWADAEDVNAEELIQEFYCANPGAP